MKYPFVKFVYIIVGIVISSVTYAGPLMGVPQLFDPTLSVVNQSNKAYSMQWESGTADKLNDSLTLKVKNHGTVDIKPNSKNTVEAHFLTLQDNNTIPKKSHLFCIKLFDKNHEKVAESHIIHNIIQNKCGVTLSDIKIVINKEGIPIIIIDNEAKS